MVLAVVLMLVLGQKIHRSFVTPIDREDIHQLARSLDVPVISVSEDMSVIAVYRGDLKHPLEPIPRLLSRANQALQTLERYKNRLDEVTSGLSTVEVEDLVTVRDVALASTSFTDA